MLTFHPNTAICDIASTSFVTKNGKPCYCSELFFIDGNSMKYYDFGKLARQFQHVVIHRSKLPITREELEKFEKEEHVNGFNE